MEIRSNPKCIGQSTRVLHLSSGQKYRSTRETLGDNFSRNIRQGRPMVLLPFKLTITFLQYKRMLKGTQTKLFLRKDRSMTYTISIDRRKQLRVDYKACLGKKERILQEKSNVSGNVLELIDRFRAILDAMLGDDNGFYQIEEILDVSRELDDMISFYYRTSGADFLNGYMPKSDYVGL